MARKSPADVRATLSRRQPGKNAPVVAGIPALAAAEIRRLEATRLSPGAVATSLASWERFVHGPVRVLAEQNHECPCCDPFEPRRTLREALAALSPLSRRALRARVEPLDEMFRRRTRTDVFASSDRPSWDLRF
jgi:hypothetical protein